MAQLVDSRGFNLTPQFGGIGSGLNTLAQFQQFGKQNIAMDKQAQIRSILAQQQAPQTQQQQQLAEQSAGFDDPQSLAEQPQILSLAEKKELSKQVDPAQANKIFESMGIDDPALRAEASRFGSLLENTPFEQRAGVINARIQEIQARGGDAKDTIQLLEMDETQQNQAALGIQLADLSTKDRLGFKAKQSVLAGKRIEAKDVKSSTILDDGTTIQVLKDGGTQVTAPDGRVLEGEERIQAIKDAQSFGVSIQQQRSKGRELGKGAGKIALDSFETVGLIKENILDLKRGIDLIEKEGATTGYISDFLPNMKAATRKFANLRRKLGLNVVASVTFGALSEGELNLAMDVALPKGINEAQTVSWLKERIEAQEKLANNLEDAALYLADHSVADLIRRNRDMAKAAKKKEKVTAQALPSGVTEDDITATMKANSMTREQVLSRLSGAVR